MSTSFTHTSGAFTVTLVQAHNFYCLTAWQRMSIDNLVKLSEWLKKNNIFHYNVNRFTVHEPPTIM